MMAIEEEKKQQAAEAEAKKNSTSAELPPPCTTAGKEAREAGIQLPLPADSFPVMNPTESALAPISKMD